MLRFYTPWKDQKTFEFLTFSGSKENGHWAKEISMTLELQFRKRQVFLRLSQLYSGYCKVLYYPHFEPMLPFYTPRDHQKTFRSFRGYKKETLARDGLNLLRYHKRIICLCFNI